MKISMVTTTYHSSPYLQEFHDRCVKAVEQLGFSYEFVFVNDGCPGDSLKTLVDLQSRHKNIVIVNLTKNFGHHKAMMAAIEHASGDQVFLIDCDLEEVPELLLIFSKKMQKHPDADVVYGFVDTRDGGFLKRHTGTLFYKVFNWLSSVKIPENIAVVRLMSRRYVDSLLLHKEAEVMIGGLWAMTGYKQIGVAIEKKFKGETHYNLKRQLYLALTSIIIFSSRPLWMLFGLGGLISLMSLFVIVWYFAVWAVTGISVPGYMSLILSIWLLGGLTIFSMGVVGVYISIIFKEVKLRPRYLVKEVLKGEMS